MVVAVDKLKLRDLIDVAELQPIIDMAFDALAGATSLIDIEGNVLCASGWQEICTKFHRVHPVACQACIASDVQYTRKLSRGQAAVVDYCPHGLIDCASPIVIDDIHVGNVFIGQVLTEPPDVQRFKRQARRYGFDEAAYLAALAKVPIISRDELERTLPFINAVSVMVAELGLAHLKNVEREQHLRKAQRIAGFGSWTLENSSRSMTLSSQARRLIGMPGRRRPTLDTFLERVHPDDRVRVAETLESSIERRGPGGVEHRIIDTDGGEVRHVAE
jgi:ligand-binding sensor protein